MPDDRTGVRAHRVRVHVEGGRPDRRFRLRAKQKSP